jgi:hypothetical protein
MSLLGRPPKIAVFCSAATRCGFVLNIGGAPCG